MLHFCKCKLEHTVVFMFGCAEGEKKSYSPVLYQLIGLDTENMVISLERQEGEIS